MARKTRKLRKTAFLGPAQCHPRLRTPNGKCLPPEKLQELARSLGAPRGLKGNRLRNWIIRRTRCRSERCWVEKAPMHGGSKQELIHKFFRPTRPESWKNDPDDWLDSLNIEQVMKQYEETYPEFKFFGAVPIDFSAPNPNNLDGKHCVEQQMCELNLKKLAARGITKLGYVFNLDPSTKDGSHWMSGFTDIPAHQTYFFDSYGYEPPPQVARFMRSLTVQDPEMKLEFCSRRFQYSDSECGMYCIIFIMSMLEGVDFKSFCRNPIPDKDVFQMRKWFYAPKDE
jgi:hypothetical protein